MQPNGTATRLSTYVDIPLEIGLPHFIQDDSMGASGHAFGNFKLSLQSVVCHRGRSVNSGHYIALVRGQALSISTPSLEAEAESTSEQWMQFDDLASPRVIPINIKQTLREELPYLLFYQVQPLSPDNSSDDPPPYTSDSGTADVSASSTPLATSRSNSLDPGYRSSLNVPSDAIAAATPARRGSLVSALLGAADDGAPPIPRATNATSSSTNVSRRNSRIITSTSRTNSSSGEARTSSSFLGTSTRVESKEHSQEKDTDNLKELPKEAAAAKTDQRLERKKIKKEKEREKRGKSRSRAGRVERGEERECLVM